MIVVALRCQLLVGTAVDLGTAAAAVNAAMNSIQDATRASNRNDNGKNGRVAGPPLALFPPLASTATPVCQALEQVGAALVLVLFFASDLVVPAT
jgi:hypothetical protein